MIPCLPKRWFLARTMSCYAYVTSSLSPRAYDNCTCQSARDSWRGNTKKALVLSISPSSSPVVIPHESNVKHPFHTSSVLTGPTTQYFEDNPQGEGVGIVVSSQQTIIIRDSTFLNNTVGKKVSKYTFVILLTACGYPAKLVWRS